jgi:hypothetical protein
MARFFCQDENTVREYDENGKLLLIWDCRGMDMHIGCNVPSCPIHSKVEVEHANVSTVS